MRVEVELKYVLNKCMKNVECLLVCSSDGFIVADKTQGEGERGRESGDDT